MAGDNFDAAAGAAEAQKKQLLAAMASGGQAAANALAQGQQQVAAMRAAALNNALSTAAQRGAPAGANAALSQTISQPYDRLGAALASSSASRSADFAQMGAAANNYFGQLAAGIPAARAAAERESAVRRQRELDAAARAKASEAPTTPIKDITNAFGGMGNLGRYLQASSQQYRDIERAAVNPTTSPRGENHSSMTDAELERQGLEVVGQDLGLPAGYSTSLVPAKAATPAKASDPVARKLGIGDDRVKIARSSGTYSKWADYISAQKDDGVSSAAIRAAILTNKAYKSYPITLNVLLADLL